MPLEIGNMRVREKDRTAAKIQCKAYAFPAVQFLKSSIANLFGLPVMQAL